MQPNIQNLTRYENDVAEYEVYVVPDEDYTAEQVEDVANMKMAQLKYEKGIANYENDVVDNEVYVVDDED